MFKCEISRRVCRDGLGQGQYMSTVLQLVYEKTLPTATPILFGNFSASTDLHSARQKVPNKFIRTIVLKLRYVQMSGDVRANWLSNYLANPALYEGKIKIGDEIVAAIDANPKLAKTIQNILNDVIFGAKTPARAAERLQSTMRSAS